MDKEQETNSITKFVAKILGSKISIEGAGITVVILALLSSIFGIIYITLEDLNSMHAFVLGGLLFILGFLVSRLSSGSRSDE